MKTLALAVLMSGLFVAVGAGAEGSAEERPLALAHYNGSQPDVAERYRIEVVTRRLPVGDATFECLIMVSPKYVGGVKAPLLADR